MNEADADFELRRLFLGFGSAIAIFILLYAARVLRVYFLGRRVRAVVAKVLKKEADPIEPRSAPRFSYVLEYFDRQGALRHIHERQELSVQEYEVGAVVTAFVQNDRLAEILSWRRIVFSSAVIALIFGALIASYYVLLGQKTG